MPVTARLAAAMAVLAALAGTARAQMAESGKDRFFFEGVEGKSERQHTTYDGSLTSTTFLYKETGDKGTAPQAGAEGPLTASPVSRVFTDLRGQLDAKHIAGSHVDFRADVRGRYTTSYVNTTTPEGQPADNNPIPFQSGRLAGQELEVRELYVKRTGDEYDMTLGRQFALELAATKFDGLKLERRASKEWTYILMGGLYPTKGSRDIRSDYPESDGDAATPGVQPGGKRVMPLVGGAGAAYRFERAYGAFGVVGILPMADDQSTGTLEKPRVFATANGYWRVNPQLDAYHYLVLDAMGASGAGVTNATLGLNYQPTETVRTYVQATRIDTETLNVTAQTQLEDPDTTAGGQPIGTAVQNNIAVSRIAQNSARAGLSVSFRDRFEVLTIGGVRQRPELDVTTGDGTMQVVFPAAENADLTLQLVDRKSFKDMRIALSATRSFGIGNANLYRNKSLVARLSGSKQVADGKGEVEGDFTYLSSADDNRGTACNLASPTTISACYGSAKVTSFTGSALLFYRFKPSWFLVTSATVGEELMSATDNAGDLQPQPALLVANLFLRLAYRF